MTQVIVAPDLFPKYLPLTTKVVFLGGGISDCPDWQSEMIAMLSGEEDLLLLNPRRSDFPMDIPSEAERQIRWEYEKLNFVGLDAIVFWFPKETLCPIALYELGFQLGKMRFKWEQKNYGVVSPRLFIGMHPEYQRSNDVYIQTHLAGYHHPIFNDLGHLASAIQHWNRGLTNSND